MPTTNILAELPKHTRKAVQFYWQTRAGQSQKQRDAGGSDQGSRSAVTGGAQMDGFIALLTKLVIEAGIDPANIYHKDSLELPGYFRPSKRWDFLVVVEKQLLVALESKSQVGPSFGNNFNNRTEEAMGSALDLWTAYRESAFVSSVRPWIGISKSQRDFVVQPSVATKKEGLRWEARLKKESTLKGLCQFMATRTQPRWGCRIFRRGPRVARKARNRWAGGLYPVGIRNSASPRICPTPGRKVAGVIEQHLIEAIPTLHRLVQGDARDLSFIPDESIHLVVTSPPYWMLKRYNDSEGQMGHIKEYEHFLLELERVWSEALSVLVPGGRLVCVVGDVCLSRRDNNGRHTVVPLHADICVQCRKLGFDNLNPQVDPDRWTTFGQS